MTDATPTRVLVVGPALDDATLIRDAFAAVADRFTVEQVARIDEAIERLQRAGVDVVLADLARANGDTAGTVRRLREAAPTVPVVVLADRADGPAAVELLREGAQDLVGKDRVDPDALVRALQFAIERHRVVRELHDAANEAQLTTDHLQAVDAERAAFVSMLTHELGTPLTSLVGFTGVLRKRWDELTDDEKRAYFEIIDRQTNRVQRLLTAAMTLSRIDAGVFEARPEPLPLAAVITVAVTGLGNGDGVEVRCPPELHVVADADLLEQIVVNLVTNAQKYGAPPIVISARERGEWVELSVCDAGAGVPEEFRERLFERFARARTPSSASPPGTGLGLAIVRLLARAQGGDAWYRPARPSGSCFGVRLPAAPPTDDL